MDASPTLPDMPLLTPFPLPLVAYEEKGGIGYLHIVCLPPPPSPLLKIICWKWTVFLQISNHVDLSLNWWYKQDPN